MSAIPDYFVTFEHARIEVGTGRGYRWTDGVFIVKPNGDKLYPPMLVSEARALCKREGWPIRERDADRDGAMGMCSELGI